MSESSSSSSGMSFTEFLTLAFVVLKLTHYIDWSWWWVLSPVWIIAGFALIVLAIAAVRMSK